MGSNKVHLFFIKGLVILTQKINNTIVGILQQRYGNIGRKINSLISNICAICVQLAHNGQFKEKNCERVLVGKWVGY